MSQHIKITVQKIEDIVFIQKGFSPKYFHCNPFRYIKKFSADIYRRRLHQKFSQTVYKALKSHSFIFSTIFDWCCQNCSYYFQGNIEEKNWKVFILFRNFSEKFRNFWQKKIGRVVKTAFYLSKKHTIWKQVKYLWLISYFD